MAGGAPTSPSAVEDEGPPPKKRLKSLTSSDEGKEKIAEEEEEKQEEEPVEGNWATCGICLRVGGQAARGFIDSCRHYFCFVCIMEWAREESRCPMCKRRFSSIRRLPKPGVFDRERLVCVPVRDQACRYLGNTARELSDSYAEVSCSECHTSKDDNLLLLCDLCDLATHTYCTGLGKIVPKGDWYCHDCSLSRDDYSKCELLSEFDNDNVCKSEAHVSIFDIVHDEGDADESTVSRSDNQGHDSQPKNVLPVTRSNNQVHERNDTSHRSTISIKESHGTSRATMLEQQYATTLHHYQYLHRRIRALRENWNAIRSGSMNFSSPVVSISSGGICKKFNRSATYSEPVQPCHLNAAKCGPVVRGSRVCEESSSKGSTDVDRAWKMLKIAKNMQRAQASNVDDNTFAGRKVAREAMYKEARLAVMKVGPSEKKDFSTKTSMDNCRDRPTSQVHRAYHFKMSNKKKPERKIHAAKDMHESSKKLPVSDAPGKQLSMSLQQDVSTGIGNQAYQKPFFKIADLIGRLTDHPCTVSSSVASCLSSDQMKVAFLSCKGQPSEMEGRMECSEASLRKDDSAKSEIQSLVKLNLKLLCRSQQLDVARFKEVARLATHTILAACGLQHARSCVWRHSKSIECSHLGHVQHVPISNIMPGSCRECFFLFVGEIVNSITSEKFT